MFMHLFKNRLKIILNDKQLIFWTLIFPIVLGTFFYMGFSGMKESEMFKPMDIAVVNTANYENDTYFKTTLEAVSTGEKSIFNLQVLSEDEAKSKLDSGKIEGYIRDKELLVNKSSLNTTILKTFLDEYLQTEQTFNNVLEENNFRIDVSKIVSRNQFC
jgi:ABC-2 type transport system permease protein